MSRLRATMRSVTSAMRGWTAISFLASCEIPSPPLAPSFTLMRSPIGWPIALKS